MPSTPERNRRYNEKKQRQVEEYKLRRGCDLCGYRRCPAALDFHHMIPKNRTRVHVRTILSTHRAEELAACSVLCSNCHREVHDDERRYMKKVHLATMELADGTLKTAKVIRLDDLRQPIHLCLGYYEAATPEELDELITDLTHERDRRVS